MEGLGLLRLLIESTGLPKEAVEKEINRLVAKEGLDSREVTLDDIRDILTTYLQDTLIEAKTALNSEAAG